MYKNLDNIALSNKLLTYIDTFEISDYDCNQESPTLQYLQKHSISFNIFPQFIYIKNFISNISC